MSKARRRPIAAFGSAVLLLIATFVIGCSRESANKAEPRLRDRVEAKLVDRGAFDAVLALNRGKVVLVDCWATWCGPCVEQLPHSVRLAKEQPTDKFALVTLSFDDPDAADIVGRTLEIAGAAAGNITNLQSAQGASSDAVTAFELGSGALPHYKLYNRAGSLHRTFELDPAAERQFMPADIEAAVAELVSK